MNTKKIYERCEKCGYGYDREHMHNIGGNGDTYLICNKCFYGENAYKCACCKTEFDENQKIENGKFCINCKALYFDGKWYKATKQ